MKTETREPISPLDCFFDPIKDNKGSYLVFNMFDFDFFSKQGYNVNLEEIYLEGIFQKWKETIIEKETRIAYIELSSLKYTIDLKAFCLYHSNLDSYKNICEKVVSEKLNRSIIFKPLPFKNNNVLHENSFVSFVHKIHKISSQIKELLLYRSILIEDHNSILQPRGSFNIFSNRIFNIIFKNKVQTLSNRLWDLHGEYFLETPDFFKKQLQKLVATLLYLHYKKFKEIHLSNFTAPSQQAAIIYAEGTGTNYSVVQHGRWMVHHLPSPLHIEYCKPSVFNIWEKEFLQSIGENLALVKTRPKSRLEINAPDTIEDYILIATSTPMFIDLDIYYKFWTLISEIQKEFKKIIKIKFHIRDNLTPLFIDFFEIKTICFIDRIETVPKYALVVNSTIYYELKEYTKVFDYKTNTSKEEITAFLNS
ncbi:hypothetical protein [Williamwhitmania taraxaci]|uniref:Uncharacterized protein n=1 Tax=Williamwhitmania taraxaci TaxID=1640674 RepID=A0A1G6GGT0_9BACT|nr:hypothetical protein [Williamwhitmania taraxaci]SDB81197.1 hypothetical protein SAMN05216323_100140 [Williamwhitmania taraxaci]